jgi:putative transcription factor
MICEICGSEVKHLTTVVVDRATLDVCDRCARFGKPVQKRKKAERPEPSRRRTTGSRKSRPGIVNEMEVVDGYGSKIRSARERKGLTQEELGKKVSEKSSTIHRLESESLAPSISLAKKLERYLKIELLEEPGSIGEIDMSSHSGSDDVTLGEMIRIKKKD